MEKSILFINASLTGGGSERVMTHVANFCSESGINTTMLLVREKERVYRVNEKINIIQLDNSCSKFRLFFRRILNIRKYIKECDVDTIVAFMDDISLFAALASIGLGKKLVLSIRNDPRRKDKKMYYLISKYINLPLADAVVFQTDAAMKCYPLKIQRKGIIIPNPINDDILLPLHDYKPENRIVAVGRLVPQKGFDLVIKAFSNVYRNHPEYVLEIYGEGPVADELKELSSTLNLGNAVIFHGFSSNVIDEIQTARMYVSGSDFEGISNTMLEALASGIPSICTDCPIGGAAMVIKDGINGLLIPVRDQCAMENAMEKIISNYDFANMLSINARKVRDEYSMKSIGDKWLSIL